MLFFAKHEISLHGRTEGVDMAVGVFSGQDILVAREWIEIEIVLDEPGGKFAIARFAAETVSQKEILRQSIGFAPAIGIVLVRTRELFLTGESLLGKMRHHGFSGRGMHG